MIEVIKKLLERPVAFHPVLALALGEIPAALMVSQGLYWQGKAEKTGEDWFFVSADQWAEIGLKVDAQARIREKLRGLGFWKEERRGMPCRLFYKIETEALVGILDNYLKTGIPVSGNPGNLSPGFPRSSSGKFRKQAAGNPGGIETNIENTLETIKRVSGSAASKKRKAPNKKGARGGSAGGTEKEPSVVYQSREIFEKVFFGIFEEEISFDWAGKHWAGIKGLYLKTRERLIGKDLPSKDPDVLIALEQFFRAAAAADPFIRDNWFTPCDLNAQYQKVIQKIISANKKGTFNETGKANFDRRGTLVRGLGVAEEILGDLAAGSGPLGS